MPTEITPRIFSECLQLKRNKEFMAEYHLEEVQGTTFLGLKLDKNLKLSLHVDKLCYKGY